jgi:hypothetical protein
MSVAMGGGVWAGRLQADVKSKMASAPTRNLREKTFIPITPSISLYVPNPYMCLYKEQTKQLEKML